MGAPLSIRNTALPASVASLLWVIPSRAFFVLGVGPKFATYVFSIHIDVKYMYKNVHNLDNGTSGMITPAQMRAARALLAMDQRELAERSGLSLPTIQRMEASDGVIRGNVDSLMKLIAALEAAGVELIGEGAASPGGGRGVRLKAVRPADVKKSAHARRTSDS